MNSTVFGTTTKGLTAHKYSIENKQGMKAILDAIQDMGCDSKYGIIASYTKERSNVDALIEMADSEIKSQVKVYDNLTPSIACHWGPEAFGFIFVRK